MYDIFTSLLSLCVYAGCILVPCVFICGLLHYLLSLPLQRRDRARFFLDLLEITLERDLPLEPAIISAAESRDLVMGLNFHLVAAHIEDGKRLGEALDAVPSFLPPQVNAMLQAGEKMGDLKRVLPACREVVRVPPDTVRNTVHYMVGLLLIFAPVAIWLISLLTIFVIPRFKDVIAGMGLRVPGVTLFALELNDSHVLILFEICLFLILMLGVVMHVGGPALIRQFQFRGLPVVDWVAWHVPWKQKKLLRAFSAMLAVLLDSGVPEAEAVRLAGESTANEICRRRAHRVMAALANGVKLDDAIRDFDGTGEFHWRLANAVHARGGFLAALRGWHEALDAKAFQQQEAATHFATSGMVILNGMVVGLIAIAIFGVLTGILKGMVFAP